jgi:hypothetical protein
MKPLKPVYSIRIPWLGMAPGQLDRRGTLGIWWAGDGLDPVAAVPDGGASQGVAARRSIGGRVVPGRGDATVCIRRHLAAGDDADHKRTPVRLVQVRSVCRGRRCGNDFCLGRRRAVGTAVQRHQRQSVVGGECGTGAPRDGRGRRPPPFPSGSDWELTRDADFTDTSRRGLRRWVVCRGGRCRNGVDLGQRLGVDARGKSTPRTTCVRWCSVTVFSSPAGRSGWWFPSMALRMGSPATAGTGS